MASTDLLVLNNSTSETTTFSSTPIDSSPNIDKIIGWLKLTNYSGLTSVDIVIEHSPRETDWTIWQAFAQLTADGFEAIEVNKSLLPKVRITATLVGSGSVDILCELYCDPDL